MHKKKLSRHFASGGAMEKSPRSKNFSSQSLMETFLRCKKLWKSFFSFSSALSPKEQLKTFVFVFAHSFSFISQLLSMKFSIFSSLLLLPLKLFSSLKSSQNISFSLLIYASQALDFGKMLYRRRHLSFFAVASLRFTVGGSGGGKKGLISFFLFSPVTRALNIFAPTNLLLPIISKVFLFCFERKSLHARHRRHPFSSSSLFYYD